MFHESNSASQKEWKVRSTSDKWRKRKSCNDIRHTSSTMDRLTLRATTQTSQVKSKGAGTYKKQCTSCSKTNSRPLLQCNKICYSYSMTTVIKGNFYRQIIEKRCASVALQDCSVPLEIFFPACFWMKRVMHAIALIFI